MTAVVLVVANVKALPYGHGARAAGTKHFSTGTKVYVEEPYWGDGGERAAIIGRHRKSHRWIRVVEATERLTNWRAKIVHDPSVLRLVRHTWRDLAQAEQHVAFRRQQDPGEPDLRAIGHAVTQAVRLLEDKRLGPTLEAAAAGEDPARLAVLSDWLEDQGGWLPAERLLELLRKRRRTR